MLPGPVVPAGRLMGPVCRVAILSDTHGDLDPRIGELVAACDVAVHGGDIGNAAVLARLHPRLGRVLAVSGNNDVPRKWPESDQGLLRQLPECIGVDLPGGRLVVIHGHQGSARHRHARLRARFPGARAVVYGHSHRLALDLDPLPWVLNPGAAGRTRTYGGPSCLVLTADAGDWQVEVHRFAFPASMRPSAGAVSPSAPERVTLSAHDRDRTEPRRAPEVLAPTGGEGDRRLSHDR